MRNIQIKPFVLLEKFVYNIVVCADNRIFRKHVICSNIVYISACIGKLFFKIAAVLFYTTEYFFGMINFFLLVSSVLYAVKNRTERLFSQRLCKIIKRTVNYTLSCVFKIRLTAEKHHARTQPFTSDVP